MNERQSLPRPLTNRSTNITLQEAVTGHFSSLANLRGCIWNSSGVKISKLWFRAVPLAEPHEYRTPPLASMLFGWAVQGFYTYKEHTCDLRCARIKERCKCVKKAWQKRVMEIMERGDLPTFQGISSLLPLPKSSPSCFKLPTRKTPRLVLSRAKQWALQI